MVFADFPQAGTSVDVRAALRATWMTSVGLTTRTWCTSFAPEAPLGDLHEDQVLFDLMLLSVVERDQPTHGHFTGLIGANDDTGGTPPRGSGNRGS